MASGERLSSATLAAAQAPDLPGYDRAVAPRIVHLGVGGFARAHLGVYADDLLRAGWPAMIRGISLRSERSEQQLMPQDGLFTVAEREPGPDRPLRVVGSFASAATGAAAAREAIAAPSTELVTLTVTEKGYAPEAAPMIVAQGLARRDRGARPPVVASLDNVQDNGALLRSRVLEVAAGIDPSLARWIDESVAFPDSVVDRMVPATTAADLDDVASRLELRDEAAVVAEQHRSWIIGGVDGLPPLADVGVQVVSDTGAYQRRKLWLLNAPHSAFAYGGLLTGRDTIADAAARPPVSAFVRRLVADVLEVADLPATADGPGFAGESLRRFANPALGHTCRQVGADGSEKLRQRIFPIVAERERRGLANERFAAVTAIWLAAVAAVAIGGRVLPAVDDPAAVDLRRVAGGADLAALAGAAVGAHTSAAFVVAVAGRLGRLVQGVDVLGED